MRREKGERKVGGGTRAGGGFLTGPSVFKQTGEGPILGERLRQKF